jgi:hypothetical protein
VFWYDIDFNEDPYQPQKRFDDNFDRTDGSGGQTSQQRPRSADERQPRGVRAEYDFREPRQKFGGDTQGAQSSRRRSGGEEPARLARGTPEASWKPAAKAATARDSSGASSSSGRGRATLAEQMAEVEVRVAELENEARALEARTLACEERLAVVNVNQALWGRRLQARF